MIYCLKRLHYLLCIMISIIHIQNQNENVNDKYKRKETVWHRKKNRPLTLDSGNINNSKLEPVHAILMRLALATIKNSAELVPSGSTLFADAKTIFRERNIIFILEMITCGPSIYTRPSKFSLSNQKEDSISALKVKKKEKRLLDSWRQNSTVLPNILLA